MKFSRLIVIVSSFCLLYSICSGVVFGLSSNEANVNITFSDETPSQGNTVVVTVTLTNLASDELEIYYFGLNFDWMDSDQFAGHDLSENPVIVSAGASTTFSPVTIQIPTDASIGAHNYFVGMDGFEGGEVFSWDSTLEVLVVQDSWQEIYADLVDQTASNLTIAENANYKSSIAQSFLEQAQSAYSSALTYASEQNWEAAISSLQSATIYLDQAEIDEENYVEPELEQDLTLIILVISAAATVIIVVLFVIIRRKPKN